jgi:hypothetical protein
MSSPVPDTPTPEAQAAVDRAAAVAERLHREGRLPRFTVGGGRVSAEMRDADGFGRLRLGPVDILRLAG